MWYKKYDVDRQQHSSANQKVLTCSIDYGPKRHDAVTGKVLNGSIDNGSKQYQHTETVNMMPVNTNR